MGHGGDALRPGAVHAAGERALAPGVERGPDPEGRPGRIGLFGPGLPGVRSSRDGDLSQPGPSARDPLGVEQPGGALGLGAGHGKSPAPVLPIQRRADDGAADPDGAAVERAVVHPGVAGAVGAVWRALPGDRGCGGEPDGRSALRGGGRAGDRHEPLPRWRAGPAGPAERAGFRQLVPPPRPPRDAAERDGRSGVRGRGVRRLSVRRADAAERDAVGRGEHAAVHGARAGPGDGAGRTWGRGTTEARWRPS